MAWFCCLPVGATAAESDAIDAFLFANHHEVSGRMRARLPEAPERRWMEEPELRISPERTMRDVRSETYSLRFRPTSRKERSSSRAVFNIENEMSNVEWNRSLSEALAERYHRVVDLANLEARAALLQQHLDLDRNYLAAEQALSATERFDVSRLQNAVLRVELREHELHLAMRRIRQFRSDTVAEMLSVSDATEPRVSGRLLRPDSIGRNLTRFVDGPPPSAYETLLAQLDVRRAEQEMALEKSRSGFGFSLMEFSYEDKVFDSYNVTLGFRLPFGQRVEASQKRVRDVVVAKQNAWLTEQLQEEAIQGAVREMRWLVDAYSANDNELQGLQVRLQGTALDGSGRAILRRHQLELLENSVSTHIELLHVYVELLDELGMLQQQPLQNWIKRGPS